jgi:hypothetical protein
MARLGLVLLLFAACAGPQAARKAPSSTLEVRCAVPEARVYVDDVFVGPADARPISVRAGARRVEIRADGWFSAYREVEAPPNGRARVEVELRPVPPLEPGS